MPSNNAISGRKVLVYSSTLLPLSNTFIKEQLLSYNRWRGVLIGTWMAAEGLSLKGLDHRLLMGARPSFFRRWIWKFRRRIGLASRRNVLELDRENADLVHAHFGTSAVEIWPVVRRLGLPMVVTLHGFDITVKRDYWETGKGGYLMKTYPARLASLAAEPNVRFIAVSDAIARKAIQFGIPAQKVTTCHIGVDTEQFKPGGVEIIFRRPRILYIGRLTEKKGADKLVNAFYQVLDKIPEAELVIAGDGPMRAQLEGLAEAAGDRICLLGAVSSEIVKLQMNEARVFCLPSLTADNGDAEGLPIAILEAGAMGLPVVICESGGNKEGVIPDITGYVVEQGDVAGLASKLTCLLEDGDMAARMSVAAREFICAEFSLSDCTRKLEQFYDTVLLNSCRAHTNV